MRQLIKNKNRQTTVLIDDNFNKYFGFEFELLVLALMTALDLELTIGQINKNISRLLTQLSLSRKKIKPKVRLAISFLLSHNLIVRKHYGYVPSNEGRFLGIKLLTSFQKNLSTH